MPIAPYALLRASLNGGAVQTGGITGSVGASVQLSADPAGLSGATNVRFEIYDYPAGFGTPSGWSSDANSIYYVGTTPPAFTLAPWGKFMLRLKLNMGISTVASIPSSQLTDEKTGVRCYSPNGVRGPAAGETNQWGGAAQWVGDMKADAQLLEDALAGGGGSGSTSTAFNKEPVFTIAETPITLSGLQTINGVAVTAGKRVLCAAQPGGIANGVYVAAVSTWARAADWDVASSVKSGCTIQVVAGTRAGATVVLSTADPIVIGTTAVSFTIRPLLQGVQLNDVPSWNGQEFVPAQPSAGTAKALVVITSSVSQSGTLTHDGVALVAGDVVLDVANATPALRGRWTIAAGSWTRPSAPTAAPGEIVAITGGTYGAGTQWQMQAASPFTLGTTAQTWARVDGQAVDGVVTTATRSATSIKTFGLPRNKSFKLVADVQIKTSSKARTHTWVVSGSTDSSGVVVLDRIELKRHGSFDLGVVEFTTGTALLNVNAYAGSTASTTWACAISLTNVAAATSIAATTKVQIKEGTPHNTVNALAYIPPRYWTDITGFYPSNSGIPNVDVVTYVQAAIDEAAAFSDGARSVWVPLGAYGLTPRLIIPAFITISGCGAARGGPAPVFYRIADSLGDAYQQALLYVDDVDHVTLQGFSVHNQGYKGDLIWWAKCNYTKFRNMTLEATEPVANSAVIQSVSGNTINWDGATSMFSNGMCIELWTRGTGVLPSPLAVNTPYFVIAKSGHTCQLSLTSGGAAITLTDAGTGIFGVVKNDRYITTVTGGATDKLGIVAHPFVNGDKVRNYNARDKFSSSLSYVFNTVSHYVVNATADDFQVSLTPGGAPVDLAAGTTPGRRIARENCGMRGGGNQYGTFDHLWFRNLGTAILMWTGESPGGVYVGCDTFTANDILCNSSNVFISGRGRFNARHEGPNYAPNPTCLGSGGDGSRIDWVGIYSEERYGSNPACSLAIGNNIGRVSGDLIGPSSSNPDSCGVLVDKVGYNTWISGWENLNINAFYRKVDTNDANVTFPTTTQDGPFIYEGSPGNGNSQGIRLWAPAARPATSQLYHHKVYRTGKGWEIGGSVYNDIRESASTNPTAFDTRLGKHQIIKGSSAHTINTLTDSVSLLADAGCFGFDGTITANSAFTTLGTGAFETLSGANFTLAPNVPYSVVSNLAGTKLRVIQPMGSVVAGTPATLSGALAASVSAANLFSAAPTAGKYEIDIDVTVGTAATSGTLQLTLAWNDGSARSETLLASPVDVSGAGPGYFRARASFRNASGNPTLATTFSGTAGPLSYTVDASVKRLS